MADRLTQEQRRKCMRAIGSKNTRPEITLRKYLHSLGYRYVLNSKLPGKPDLAFPSRKTVIFVDGCFWHGCPIHHVKPMSNSDWWQQKIGRNKARDREVDRQLCSLGWLVIRVWEHDIKNGSFRCSPELFQALGKSGRLV